jgi:hypothetical protein
MAFFQSLADRLPNFAPTHCMSDFEQGAISAFHAIFPACHQSACLFHLGQSLARNIQAKPQLRNLYIGNEYARNTLRTLQSLAFLPVNNIYSYFLYVGAALLEILNDNETRGYLNNFPENYLTIQFS